jgi:hypothetical protein
VARAKRTERAEARRRYRAATAGANPEDAQGTEAVSAPAAPRSRSSTSGPTKTATTMPTGRVGFTEAFRLSFRPMNVRQDVAALPWIATHTHALWIPLLITIGSTAIIVVRGGGDALAQFMFAYFIQTPAIGGVFIAGFLAPRASWLLGAVVGFVSAICYSLLVIAYPTTIYASAPPTDAQARDVAISALILSPIIGAFFAAGAAWYRRFLALSSPNRNKRSSQSAKAKPGDGRTRTGTTQKAGAKR